MNQQNQPAPHQHAPAQCVLHQHAPAQCVLHQRAPHQPAPTQTAPNQPAPQQQALQLQQGASTLASSNVQGAPAVGSNEQQQLKQQWLQQQWQHPQQRQVVAEVAQQSVTTVYQSTAVTHAQQQQPNARSQQQQLITRSLQQQPTTRSQQQQPNARSQQQQYTTRSQQPQLTTRPPQQKLTTMSQQRQHVTSQQPQQVPQQPRQPFQPQMAGQLPQQPDFVPHAVATGVGAPALPVNFQQQMIAGMQAQSNQNDMQYMLSELYRERRVGVAPTAARLHYFTGKPNETNLSVWKRHFNREAILASVVYDNFARQVPLLSMYTKGPAESFFSDLEDRVPRLPKWQALCDAFEHHFPDDRNAIVKVAQLFARVQQLIENIETYASDVQKLATRAIPGWQPGDNKESLVKNHFISHLLPGICRWIQNSEPLNFEAAVEEAIKHELREQQCFGSASSSTNEMAMLALANQNQAVTNLTQQLQEINMNASTNLSGPSAVQHFTSNGAVARRNNNNNFHFQNHPTFQSNRQCFGAEDGPRNKPQYQQNNSPNQHRNWQQHTQGQFASRVQPNSGTRHGNYNQNHVINTGCTLDGTIVCTNCGQSGHHRINCYRLQIQDGADQREPDPPWDRDHGGAPQGQTSYPRETTNTRQRTGSPNARVVQIRLDHAHTRNEQFNEQHYEQTNRLSSDPHAFLQCDDEAMVELSSDVYYSRVHVRMVLSNGQTNFISCGKDMYILKDVLNETGTSQINSTMSKNEIETSTSISLAGPESVGTLQLSDDTGTMEGEINEGTNILQIDVGNEIFDNILIFESDLLAPSSRQPVLNDPELTTYPHKEVPNHVLLWEAAPEIIFQPVNTENLRKCLQTANQMVRIESVQCKGVPDQYPMSNEPQYKWRPKTKHNRSKIIGPVKQPPSQTTDSEAPAMSLLLSRLTDSEEALSLKMQIQRATNEIYKMIGQNKAETAAAERAEMKKRREALKNHSGTESLPSKEFLAEKNYVLLLEKNDNQSVSSTAVQKTHTGWSSQSIEAVRHSNGEPCPNKSFHPTTTPLSHSYGGWRSMAQYVYPSSENFKRENKINQLLNESTTSTTSVFSSIEQNNQPQMSSESKSNLDPTSANNLPLVKQVMKDTHSTIKKVRKQLNSNGKNGTQSPTANQIGSSTQQSGPKSFEQIFEGLGALSRCVPLTTLITVIIVSTLAPLAKAEPFYQCGMSRNGRPLPVPTQVKYVLPPEANLKDAITVDFALWVSQSRPVMASAVRCVEIEHTVCILMGLFGQLSIVANNIEQLHVNPEHCLIVKNELHLEKEFLIELQTGVFTTNHSLTVDFIYCCQDYSPLPSKDADTSDYEDLVFPQSKKIVYPIGEKLQFLRAKIQQYKQMNFRNVCLKLCCAAERHLNLYKATQLEQRIHKLLNYTVEQSLDPDLVYKIVTGTCNTVAAVPKVLNIILVGVMLTLSIFVLSKLLQHCRASEFKCPQKCCQSKLPRDNSLGCAVVYKLAGVHHQGAKVNLLCTTPMQLSDLENEVVVGEEIVAHVWKNDVSNDECNLKVLKNKFLIEIPQQKHQKLNEIHGNHSNSNPNSTKPNEYSLIRSKPHESIEMLRNILCNRIRMLKDIQESLPPEAIDAHGKDCLDPLRKEIAVLEAGFGVFVECHIPGELIGKMAAVYKKFTTYPEGPILHEEMHSQRTRAGLSRQEAQLKLANQTLQARTLLLYEVIEFLSPAEIANYDKVCLEPYRLKSTAWRIERRRLAESLLTGKIVRKHIALKQLEDGVIHQTSRATIANEALCVHGKQLNKIRTELSPKEINFSKDHLELLCAETKVQVQQQRKREPGECTEEITRFEFLQRLLHNHLIHAKYYQKVVDLDVANSYQKEYIDPLRIAVEAQQAKEGGMQEISVASEFDTEVFWLNEKLSYKTNQSTVKTQNKEEDPGEKRVDFLEKILRRRLNYLNDLWKEGLSKIANNFRKDYVSLLRVAIEAQKAKPGGFTELYHPDEVADKLLRLGESYHYHGTRDEVEGQLVLNHGSLKQSTKNLGKTHIFPFPVKT